MNLGSYIDLGGFNFGSSPAVIVIYAYDIRFDLYNNRFYNNLYNDLCGKIVFIT